MICTDLQSQSSSFQVLFSGVKKGEQKKAELETIIEGLLVKRGVEEGEESEKPKKTKNGEDDFQGLSVCA